MGRKYHFEIKTPTDHVDLITVDIVAQFKDGEAAHGAGESPQPDWPAQKVNGYKYAQGIASLRRESTVNAKPYGDPLWA